MANGKTTKKADPAWENRVLCSDEACIGVIGPDKRCGECGREYEGELPTAFDAYALDVDDEDMPAADQWNETSERDTEPVLDDIDVPVADDEWASRILCSDESCIGVVGSDGRCKDCGKPYEG